MKIISFAYTTPALLAGRKSVTRRYWNDDYAATFKPGMIIQAWNKSPRFHGKKVAEIKIISVTKQKMIDAPDSDYEAEGFVWMCENNLKCDGEIPTPAYWEDWKNSGDVVWVVRFELIKIY